MTWEEFTFQDRSANQPDSIESQVIAKLGSRLAEFTLDEVEDKLVLRGRARSYHVKQLAQQEVMCLTNRPILHNSIEVRN
jgi:hypothetical protein